MKTRQGANAIAAIAVVVASALVMGWASDATPSAPAASEEVFELRFTTLAGKAALLDASGVAVALQDYERIIAGSIVARAIAGELCEKERLIAVTAHGVEDAPDAHRFSGLARVAAMSDTEALLALKPDLVIVNALGSVAHLQRLRDAGLNVFALGDMHGVATFVRDIEQVAVLLGKEKRGHQVAQRFAARMATVASDIPQQARKSGMYLSAYGNQLFGGTIGTSYHDLLIAGGLRDAAAADFSGWPQYTAEHVLSINPEIIVAPTGVAEDLCSRSTLTLLRACRDGRAGFVELPMSWLEDPSFIMLEVAEAIREKVYGVRQ